MAGLERGDVRIYRFDPPDKRRPVVVLTRSQSIQLLGTVTVAAITSTIRGVPSEVILDENDGMKTPCAVNLHNLTTVRQDRLGARVAVLSTMKMSQICAALKYSVGC